MHLTCTNMPKEKLSDALEKVCLHHSWFLQLPAHCCGQCTVQPLLLLPSSSVRASCTVSAVLLCKGLATTGQGCAAMPASRQAQQLPAEVCQQAYT